MNLISIIEKKLAYYLFLYTINEIEIFSFNDKKVLVITIAFNDSVLIEKQNFLLKKYMIDDFDHFVIDNSNDDIESEKIKNYCISNEVNYARVPKNDFVNNKSHAAAMHWAYFNIIKNSKYNIFGFLDHDIFPIANYSILDRMKNGVYGRVMHSYFKKGYHETQSAFHPYWSLWAGFCFFDNSLIKGRFPWSLNFFSKHFNNGDFLDTGGGLWQKLYSKLDYPGELATYRVISLDDNGNSDIQNGKVEIIDETWFHFVSLSNWRKVNDMDRKKTVLNDILNPHLKR